MSFIKTSKPQKEESYVSYNCCANGCPLPGSISTIQDKWTCSFHFRADSIKWPMVTEAIRQNESLFGVLSELHKISEIEWGKEMIERSGNHKPAQRDLFMQMFDDQPELKPRHDENKSHYEYRLYDYISVQAGVLAKKNSPTYVGTKKLSAFHNPSEFF